MKSFMYHNQIVHHKPPCFNLFILHNNLFDNQGSEINKNNIFCSFPHTVFYENFLPTLLYSLSIYIIYNILYIIYIYIIYIYIFIYIYIYMYAITKTMSPLGYHHNGFVATYAFGHMMYVTIKP